MATPLFNMRFLVNAVVSSPFGGADYRMTGFVFDESANFVGTDAVMGDEVFDFNGNRYRILNFNVQTSTQIEVDVVDYRSEGSPSTGSGVVFRPSTNFGLPIPTRQTNNISEYLKTYIENQAIEQLDQKIYETNTFVERITVSGTDITNGYVVLANNPTTSKAITAEVVGGPLQRYPNDFSIVSSNQLTWVGDFATTIEAGDEIIVTYFLA